MVDAAAPSLLARPYEQGKFYEEYGCGPASHVTFSLPGWDNSQLFALVTLKTLPGGEVQQFILPVYENKVEVGFGMCSGEFTFAQGSNNVVTFQLMDQSGNLSAPSAPIRFSAPEPKYARAYER